MATQRRAVKKLNPTTMTSLKNDFDSEATTSGRYGQISADDNNKLPLEIVVMMMMISNQPIVQTMTMLSH